MLLRKLLHICLAFIFLLNLFGCVYEPALKWAKEKSSVPITYRKIVDVHPAAVREDGNIKICIKLSCEPDDCKEQHYLVSLPFNSLTSGKTKPVKQDLQKHLNSIDPYLPIYWFPIKKPSKECVEIAEMTVPSESQIHIEKLYVPIDEWERLYDGLPKNKEDIFAILKKYNDVMQSSDILYTINIVHEDLMYEEILLTYCPDKYPDSGVHAIGILGGYKDTSTKAGYALVPLALIADVAIFVVVVAGIIIYFASSLLEGLEFK
ncbi:MAG: hypothetical protein JRJ27_15920 [Deltaproteobacteria bacterium]|nr:hypothetical protein [Deltaproteobacteria bacterium]